MIVIKGFRDKITGERYSVGKKYESVDPKRLKTLKDMGFLEGDLPEVETEVKQDKPRKRKK